MMRRATPPGFTWRESMSSRSPSRGPGAPLVREFCVAEFAAAIGVGTEIGKRYLGHALELRYRLPKLWTRIQRGDLAAWKARRVAHETISHALDPAAAGFVDAHVAPVAHKIRPTALDRVVDEAIVRFMPATAERRRREAAAGRHFTIEANQVSFTGTSLVSGELDLADALDLEDAIRGTSTSATTPAPSTSPPTARVAGKPSEIDPAPRPALGGPVARRVPGLSALVVMPEPG